MRNRFLYPMFFLLVLASGCSKDEDSPLPENGSPFVLQVEAKGYRPTALTRATESGLTTTFAKNDQIGVIITHPDNSMEHVVYTYNGYSWTTATTPLYYDSKDIYSAYYPYRWDLEGKSIEEIKSAFEPVADQSDYATGYAVSDLMTCERAEMGDDKKLKIKLSHVFAQLRMPASEPVTVEYINGKVYDCTYPISGIVFYVNGIPCRPWVGGDGYVRLIVKDTDTPVSIKSGYTSSIIGRAEVNAIEQQTFAPGLCYTISVPVSDAGKYENFRIGDFLCRDAEGECYVLPQEANGNKNCVGIVFHVGEHDSDGFDYSTTAIGQNDCHGYAVALTDAVQSTWGPYPSTVVTSTDNTDWKGYSNHQTLMNTGLDYRAAKSCANYGVTTNTQYAAPQNSSGWFLPSCGQLKDLYDNRNSLQSSVTKAGGKWFLTYSSSYYWSSTELSERYAWRVYFLDGYRFYNIKTIAFNVRAVLAF